MRIKRRPLPFGLYLLFESLNRLQRTFKSYALAMAALNVKFSNSLMSDVILVMVRPMQFTLRPFIWQRVTRLSL